MGTTIAALLATAGLALGAAPAGAPVAEPPRAAAEPAQAAELIVRFAPGATRAERLDAREEAGTEFESSLPVTGMQVVEVAPGQTAHEAERALEADDAVLYAEPNAERRAFLRPNDPYFDSLWAMENRGQSIRGTPGVADADADVAETWDANISGTTVVAVVDSGVDTTHADLSANIWRNPGETGLGRESNGVDDDLNGRVDDWRGWDFVGLDNNPADENGHGTHVAGTIAAQRGNGVGVAGVTANASIMPLRTLDANGSGKVSDVILAYSYAAQMGARVVNLSLGSTMASRAERDTIAAFPTVLFVAAAGNGGADGVGDDNDAAATYPCAYTLPNVVCVAASDNRDQLASFSNYGKLSVDLAAPGVAITSTWPGGGYSWSSGTSMATPHVAGAAALLWSASPGATVVDIDTALRSGVDASQAFTNKTVTGGRLNVLRSLRMVADVAVGTPAPAPPPGGSTGSAPDPSPGGSPSGSPARAGDATAPRLSVRVTGGQSLSSFLRRGLVVRLRSSEASSVRLALRLGARALSGRPAVPLVANRGKQVAVRLTRPGVRTLQRRRSGTVDLVARATDRAGNVRTVRVAVRFSR